MILAALGEARRFQGTHGAVLEGDKGGKGIVDGHLRRAALRCAPLWDEGPGESLHALRLTDQIAGEVDDVGAEITQHARSGLGRIETPDHLELRTDDPFLKVAGAEMIDPSQASG